MIENIPEFIETHYPDVLARSRLSTITGLADERIQVTLSRYEDALQISVQSWFSARRSDWRRDLEASPVKSPSPVHQSLQPGHMMDEENIYKNVAERYRPNTTSSNQNTRPFGMTPYPPLSPTPRPPTLPTTPSPSQPSTTAPGPMSFIGASIQTLNVFCPYP